MYFFNIRLNSDNKSIFNNAILFRLGLGLVSVWVFILFSPCFMYIQFFSHSISHIYWVKIVYGIKCWLKSAILLGLFQFGILFFFPLCICTNQFTGLELCMWLSTLNVDHCLLNPLAFTDLRSWENTQVNVLFKYYLWAESYFTVRVFFYHHLCLCLSFLCLRNTELLLNWVHWTRWSCYFEKHWD